MLMGLTLQSKDTDCHIGLINPICCLPETHHTGKDKYRLRGKEWYPNK
jgi:hypothetical protein